MLCIYVMATVCFYRAALYARIPPCLEYHCIYINRVPLYIYVTQQRSIVVQKREEGREKREERREKSPILNTPKCPAEEELRHVVSTHFICVCVCHHMCVRHHASGELRHVCLYYCTLEHYITGWLRSSGSIKL